MKSGKLIFLLLFCIAASVPQLMSAAPRTALGSPDLDDIREAIADPESEYYYPALLKSFLSNDTTMTDKQFQYFYYGTMYQEDYDPYRPVFRPKELDVLKPIYQKQNQSRSELNRMREYAVEAIKDNPVDIRQLAYLVYVYERTKKYDHAKIWQYKLNHILLVIASSGVGTEPETARIVVYPEHEYDLLNLAGYTATGHQFEEPCYDLINVNPRNANDPTGFYFDISEMLKMYFLKHPSEIEIVE